MDLAMGACRVDWESILISVSDHLKTMNIIRKEYSLSNIIIIDQCEEDRDITVIQDITGTPQLLLQPHQLYSPNVHAYREGEGAGAQMFTTRC